MIHETSSSSGKLLVLPRRAAIRGRYVKAERNPSRWIYIPDTSEALALAIRCGAMFATWCAFSHEPGGELEPVRYGDLPLDFDCKEDPNKALHDLRRLCLNHVPETLGIDSAHIRFYCSGGKGFHAEIPATLLGTEAGRLELPLIYKIIADKWNHELNITTLDLSMYAMGKGKMFRLANVKRSNGRYKVPISRDDIAYASIEDLLQMSEKPKRA